MAVAGCTLVAEDAENHALWEDVVVDGKARGDAGKRRREKEGGTADGGQLCQERKRKGDDREEALA